LLGDGAALEFGLEPASPLARCAAWTFGPAGAATPAVTPIVGATGNALPPSTAISMPRGTS
jgi:hypothetical protein